MNKDKRENKVKFDKIKEAISVLYGTEMEIPKYEPRDIGPEEKWEDFLMEELLFVAKNSKKYIRRKRIRLFFVGPFIPANVRTLLKKEYKRCKQACKYLLKNKKELRNYMSLVKLGILDPYSTWVEPIYNSGDRVLRRIKNGRVESRGWSSGYPGESPPVYKEIESTFVHADGSRKAKINKPYMEEEEKNFLIEGPKILEVVGEEMARCTTGPFKGQADFRKQAKSIVDKQVQLALNMNTRYLSPKTKQKWLAMFNTTMHNAWKKRVKCTENSENSSTQKDDDSQS